MGEDFQQENGLSSDLDQKRNGILLTNTNRKENGTELRNKWWWNLQKADTQFSVLRVQCPEERSEAKEVENYRYTSVPMVIRSTSSVSKEQSQTCVKNTVAVKQEHKDLLWQSNLTHFSRRQTYWEWHLDLRLRFLHKKISCRSTRNEWKGFHNQIDW